ncbi:MAG: 1-deoxy-D-xylulose-5-phosphate reductoisomerase [Candidatus Eremiobacteraeota bacterium]|nr:1-deoxy-D-xylulose-5-phosphate reductoisomerase [Candidatus Eremiobacteraeota bacterium]MBC5801917.1 1-deoxy-D-xylulose-5-phosphate reductoisomerase [Candidatus Eremiobacteraeota bacterium]MBC5821750.1 1-deoxy-D-xylulose-5-phosphate reductoisomerase [Candidatus Eremiobacteraeota bacterium]
MRKIAILGATGSIGTQALEVVARHPDRFTVVGLAAGSRVADLLQQAQRFGPRVVSCANVADAAPLRAALPAEVRVTSGATGLLAVAAESGADIVVAATDGAVAFDAVFGAVERGLRIAVANKELIVAAGELLMAAAARSGAEIVPVDSEHSALFQCLVGEPPGRVASLVLTASGGPFWEWERSAIAGAAVADALRHPTWQMGTKNTVDSASLMNKGLEVIEASRLFGVPADRIDVLVHRTSVAHGFVVFSDGNVKAQLAPPDMRLPIGYALAYPDRLPDQDRIEPLVALGARGDAAMARLDFVRPDFARFPCLGLAYAALRRGGVAPAVLSAANEIAVDAFVQGNIPFGAIADIVAAALEAVPAQPLSLASVRTADARAREAAHAAVEARLALTPNRP